jgi:flavin-dependent dehydrogenase
MPQVVIVGGGPAGASAGVTLARLGLKPIVLEARPCPELKVGECLPPSAGPILEQLGLKDRLQHDGHLPSFGNRSIWGSATPVERDFIFGTQGHGWLLDRLKFEAALALKAQEAGVDWRYGHRLLACSRRDGRMELAFQSASGNVTLEADFLVDATGRAARIARTFGAQQLRYDRLIGTALLLKAQAGRGIQDSLTLVEAVATGWWYSARLPDDKMMLVYMSDSDLVDQRAREAAGLLALLENTDHTLGRVRNGGVGLGGYSPLGGPRIQQAGSSRLDAVAGDGWVAVGDAAAAFDPLSSYGISSAMGSGFYAASAIVDYLAGSTDALPSYQKLIDDAYAQYLLMHYDYYSLERRWPDELFWQRRHAREPLRQSAGQEMSVD